MAVKQLSDGNPDGTQLGQSTTDPIGFWGKTCTAPITFITSISAAQTSAVVWTRLNQLRASLIRVGLMKSS